MWPIFVTYHLVTGRVWSHPQRNAPWFCGQDIDVRSPGSARGIAHINGPEAEGVIDAAESRHDEGFFGPCISVGPFHQHTSLNAATRCWRWAGGGGRALPPSRWKAGTVPMRETCRAPPPPPQRTLPSTGQPENCSAGGGGGVDMDARRRRGGGVGEMGFRVGPFVLCKNGCWRQRHRNTKFGPKKFFPAIIPPPPPHI